MVTLPSARNFKDVTLRDTLMRSHADVFGLGNLFRRFPACSTAERRDNVPGCSQDFFISVSLSVTSLKFRAEGKVTHLDPSRLSRKNGTTTLCHPVSVHWKSLAALSGSYPGICPKSIYVLPSVSRKCAVVRLIVAHRGSILRKTDADAKGLVAISIA